MSLCVVLVCMEFRTDSLYPLSFKTYSLTYLFVPYSCIFSSVAVQSLFFLFTKVQFSPLIDWVVRGGGRAAVGGGGGY